MNEKTAKEMLNTVHKIPERALRDGDRLVVNFHAHHEQDGEQPQSVQAGFSMMLGVGTELYSHGIQITEKGDFLDFGWVKNPGYIYIENKKPWSNTKPTKDEIKEFEKRIVLISIGPTDPPIFIVKPGGIFFAQIAIDQPLYVRCESGETKVKLSVFPK